MVHFRIHMQDCKRIVFRKFHQLPAPTKHTEPHGITHCTVFQRWKGLIHSTNDYPWNHCQTMQHLQHSCNTRVRYQIQCVMIHDVCQHLNHIQMNTTASAPVTTKKKLPNFRFMVPCITYHY